MRLTFEWNEAKARANLKKHGVSFEEASTVFADTLSVTIPDPLHSDEENRLVTIGATQSHKILVIVHCDRGDRIRIISARPATAKERKNYEG
ncbi:MAG: BrnT family toxin [Sulfuricaulis sp.]|nr:BrnT family toxin [Sulfuricaulis sp.]